MTTQSTCPDEAVFQRLLRLEDPVEETDRLLDHIESCEACQQRFEKLSAADPSGGAGRKSITRSDLETAAHAVDNETLKATAQEIWDRLVGNGLETPRQPIFVVPCQVRQYELTRLIDIGGMGEVYEGRHLHLKRPVAVKVIRAVRRDDPAARQGFLREIAAAGQVEHANLVKAYDAWEEGGDLFLAQELLDGESLFALADSHSLGDLDAVFDVIVGVCRGLQHLHAHGLVHRDVTPANVMRLGDGSIKLIDYGLAGAAERRADAEEDPTAIVGGTRGFMSPEQKRGLGADARSDIYAVGMLLQFLLEQSDSGGEGQDTATARTRATATETQPLQRLAAWCTQAKPSDRPHDIDELLVKLTEVREEITAGRRQTTARRAGRYTTVGLSLFCVSALLPAALWFRNPADPEIPPLVSSVVRVKIEAGLSTDQVEVTGPDGTVRQVPAMSGSSFALHPGRYWFSLAGVPGRAVDPAFLAITADDPAVIRVVGSARGSPAEKTASAPAVPPPRLQGPVMVPMTDVPAGSFLMGAGADDDLALSNERPQQKVVFHDGFRISTYEITVGQFREFVRCTGYVTEAEASGKGGWQSSRTSSWGKNDRRLNWMNPGYPLADSLPVTVVTHNDAQAFCAWLSQRNKGHYRLPTEAEWEYACRAGTTTRFAFPEDEGKASAWTRFNVKETVMPRPVGTRLPNKWGLFDTVGNVREWCADWYVEKPGQGNPTGQLAPPAETDAKQMRVVRGACFIDLLPFMRSSWRGYLRPAMAVNNQGFRVVGERSE